MDERLGYRGWVTLLLAAAAALGNAPLTAAADSSVAATVKIGMPPWPGATIKSQIVGEILEPLGYHVKFVKASAPIVQGNRI